jgi:dCTP deaminase (dUMP-forming)
MTFLTGNDIVNMGIVDRYTDEQIQPCSIDLTLGNEFIVYKNDVLVADEFNDYEMFTAEKIMLIPYNYKFKDISNYDYLKEKYNVDVIVEGGLLGTTNEVVKIPNNMIGFYDGRSSLGRLFLDSHVCAGLIDSGFYGKITLEIVANVKPVILQSGMRIGQLSVAYLNKETFEYCGKYQNQQTVVASKLYVDFGDRSETN